MTVKRLSRSPHRWYGSFNRIVFARRRPSNKWFHAHASIPPKIASRSVQDAC